MDGYLLVTLPCRTRAAPGLQARTRSRASPSSRTCTRAGHVTIRPGYRLYTMGPAHAHASGSHLGPTAKLKSRPLRTSRRLAGLTRTARRDALLSRHDSLRPPASSGRTSRTNHDSTQPTCAQWSWSRSSRTGVAGPAPGPTAADPSGATRLALPPGAGLDECAASGCAHHGARRPAPPKASSAVHIHTAAVEARYLPRSHAARPVHIHSAGASSLVGAKRNRAPTKLRVDDALSMQAHETAPPAREAQARQRGARRGPSAHDGAFPSPERMTPLLTLSTALGIRAQGCAHVVPDAPEQREA